MEWNPTTIGIVAAFWLLGYVLGLAEEKIRNKRKQRKEEELALDELPPPAPPPAPEQAEAAALSVFEKAGGKLELKLDDTVLADISELQPPQRKRLISLVVGLRPWLEESKEKKIAAPPTRLASEAVSAQPVPASPATPASTDISTGETDYSNLSMVQQVDRVLQRNLSGHPLQERGIRVQESITGGVNFYIGTARYEFIDEIPDDEIRQFIQKAISDWENSATPGL